MVMKKGRAIRLKDDALDHQAGADIGLVLGLCTISMSTLDRPTA